MKQIWIRVDANQTIGYGHLMRCISLAEILASQFSIKLFINEPGTFGHDIINQSDAFEQIIFLQHEEEFLNEIKKKENGIVVIDGYHFPSTFQDQIKLTGNKLVCIDDLHDGIFNCDVIINYSPGANKSSYQTERNNTFYLGMEYALLRKPFLEYTSSDYTKTETNSLLISMGGSDPFNYSTYAIEKAIKGNPKCRFKLLITESFKYRESLLQFVSQSKCSIEIVRNLSSYELIELIESVDICITSASTISLEVIMVNSPLLLIKTAENQSDNFDFLIKKGAAMGFNEWMEDPNFDRNKMIKEQNKITGTDQVRNISEIFENL